MPASDSAMKRREADGAAGHGVIKRAAVAVQRAVGQHQ